MIACNKMSGYPLSLYQERLSTIEFFQNYYPHEFDLYGIGWPPSMEYQGTITTKTECLKRYKFCICYENTKDLDGYITEKIFDCFVAGCVRFIDLQKY